MTDGYVLIEGIVGITRYRYGERVWEIEFFMPGGYTQIQFFTLEHLRNHAIFRTFEDLQASAKALGLSVLTFPPAAKSNPPAA